MSVSMRARLSTSAVVVVAFLVATTVGVSIPTQLLVPGQQYNIALNRSNPDVFFRLPKQGSYHNIVVSGTNSGFAMTYSITKCWLPTYKFGFPENLDSRAAFQGSFSTGGNPFKICYDPSETCDMFMRWSLPASSTSDSLTVSFTVAITVTEPADVPTLTLNGEPVTQTNLVAPPFGEYRNFGAKFVMPSTNFNPYLDSRVSGISGWTPDFSRWPVGSLCYVSGDPTVTFPGFTYYTIYTANGINNEIFNGSVAIQDTDLPQGWLGDTQTFTIHPVKRTRIAVNLDRYGSNPRDFLELTLTASHTAPSSDATAIILAGEVDLNVRLTGSDSTTLVIRQCGFSSVNRKLVLEVLYEFAAPGSGSIQLSLAASNVRIDNVIPFGTNVTSPDGEITALRIPDSSFLSTKQGLRIHSTSGSFVISSRPHTGGFCGQSIRERQGQSEGPQMLLVPGCLLTDGIVGPPDGPAWLSVYGGNHSIELVSPQVLALDQEYTLTDVTEQNAPFWTVGGSLSDYPIVVDVTISSGNNVVTPYVYRPQGSGASCLRRQERFVLSFRASSFLLFHPDDIVWMLASSGSSTIVIKARRPNNRTSIPYTSLAPISVAAGQITLVTVTMDPALDFSGMLETNITSFKNGFAFWTNPNIADGVGTGSFRDDDGSRMITSDLSTTLYLAFRAPDDQSVSWNVSLTRVGPTQFCNSSWLRPSQCAPYISAPVRSRVSGIDEGLDQTIITESINNLDTVLASLGLSSSASCLSQYLNVSCNNLATPCDSITGAALNPYSNFRNCRPRDLRSLLVNQCGVSLANAVALVGDSGCVFFPPSNRPWGPAPGLPIVAPTSSGSVPVAITAPTASSAPSSQVATPTTASPLSAPSATSKAPSSAVSVPVASAHFLRAGRIFSSALALAVALIAIL